MVEPAVNLDLIQYRIERLTNLAIDCLHSEEGPSAALLYRTHGTLPTLTQLPAHLRIIDLGQLRHPPLRYKWQRLGEKAERLSSRPVAGRTRATTTTHGPQIISRYGTSDEPELL